MKITKRPPSNDGLSNSYISATEKILNSLSGTNPQSVKVGFEKTLRETVASLDAANAAAVRQSVADGTKASQRRFVSGLAAMFEGGTLTVSNLSAIGFDIKNPRAAQDVLDRKAQDVNATAVYRRNFLELRSKLVGASRDLQSEVNGVLDKSSDGGDYTQSLDALKDNLIKRGCFSVQYSNGASVGVDKYASMVCRSARTESANTENLRISKAFGTDLVECVGSSVTCKVCAQYRGRVFSISGEDKRYPPLRDGANSPLKNGYDVIHPNCRCEFRPYFEALHSEEENGEKRKFSNRPFDGDKRTEAQAKAYQQRQAENRRALEEQSRWNELQALLGKDNPYTNLSSMRRALDADKDSFAYKASHNIKDDYAQYKEWTDIVGQENMPKSLAEFQELKYNDNDKFEILLNDIRDEKVREQIRSGYPLTIQTDKQGKHIRGSKTFIEGRSEIYLSVEECQEIVDNCSSKGRFKYDINGNWQNKEIVETDNIIGCTVNLEGERKETNCATIHYSKNGTHIVPYSKK